VLMAAFNGEKWIRAQIESIEAQKEIDLTIFISLDVSTDNSLTIINELAKKYNNIIAYKATKRFGSAAPNFFYLLSIVDFSDFSHIALSDQDDIWLPQKLVRAVRLLDKEGCDGYSSDVTAFWSDGRTKLIKKSYPQRQYDYYFEGPGPGCTFVLSKLLTVQIQKHLHDKSINLYKIDWHDWFIYMYARSFGYKWIIDRMPTMEYRQHQGNQLGANSGIKQLVKRISAVTSGYAIAQARLNFKALGIIAQPISQWLKPNRLSLMQLALRSNNCRRKIIDRYLFFFSCILMAVSPRRTKH